MAGSIEARCLLVAHMDVVGVDKPKWTVDPFRWQPSRTDIRHGRVRAIDNKAMLATNLAASACCAGAGEPRVAWNRDVIFLATDDEEQGGDASIKVLIAKYYGTRSRRAMR